MSKCVQYGCRNLLTTCTDCGRMVCTATFSPPGQWISVKDALPDDESDVLVVDVELPGSMPVISWYLKLLDAEGFYCPSSNLRIVCSHWMLLPKAPNE